MGVFMADRQLGVMRRTVAAMDAHGDAAVTTSGTTLGPWPGRAREEQDGTWTIAVDPAAWPIEPRDLVVEPATGREWVITASQLMRNTLDPVVDYVRISAMLRTSGDAVPPQETANQVGPA